jgi:hypothetical protein
VIAWYERVLAPVIMGGGVYLYGLAQGHGTGFRTFVRYAAAFSGGIAAVIATTDLLKKVSPNTPIMVGMLWTALVGFIGWKRHLA